MKAGNKNQLTTQKQFAMTIITRDLPNSNTKRLQVLTDAFNQKAAVPPGDNIFTAATSARLDAIKPLFQSKLEAVKDREEELGVLSTNKAKNFAKLHMTCSHFMQVFNFAVERHVFPKDARTFYGLDKETGKLPSMNTEDELKAVALHLKKGEDDRIAAGGAPMTNPSIGDVTALSDDFNKFVTDHQTATLALIAAQSQVNEQVIEADKVIKKIYDEAEAVYNELDAPAQREACRQWGVIYISVGSNTLVTVQVNHLDGSPYAGIEVKLVEAAGKKLITNTQGKVVFDTKVVGNATVEVRLLPGYDGNPNATLDITIVESIPMTVVIEL